VILEKPHPIALEIVVRVETPIVILVKILQLVLSIVFVGMVFVNLLRGKMDLIVLKIVIFVKMEFVNLLEKMDLLALKIVIAEMEFVSLP